MTTTPRTAPWSEPTDMAERVAAQGNTIAAGAVRHCSSPSVALARKNDVRIATVPSKAEALARAVLEPRCAGVGP